MMTKSILANTVLGAAVFCGGITLAQDPVQDIDRRVNPNLAEAQHHVVEANNYILAAQKDNRYDMKGHADLARDYLVKANLELKAAARAADTPVPGQKRK